MASEESGFGESMDSTDNINVNSLPRSLSMRSFLSSRSNSAPSTTPTYDPPKPFSSQPSYSQQQILAPNHRKSLANEDCYNADTYQNLIYDHSISMPFLEKLSVPETSIASAPDLIQSDIKFFKSGHNEEYQNQDLKEDRVSLEVTFPSNAANKSSKSKSHLKAEKLMHSLFRGIPHTERLFKDHICAYQRDNVLQQGKMYLTENYIGFHSNVLGFVTNFEIPISQVKSVERAKSAFIFPTAIVINTKFKSYFFACFINRELAFSNIEYLMQLRRAKKKELDELDTFNQTIHQLLQENQPTTYCKTLSSPSSKDNNSSQTLTDHSSTEDAEKFNQSGLPSIRTRNREFIPKLTSPSKVISESYETTLESIDFTQNQPNDSSDTEYGTNALHSIASIKASSPNIDTKRNVKEQEISQLYWGIFLCVTVSLYMMYSLIRLESLIGKIEDSL